MRLPRQEKQSGFTFPPPGDLPQPRIELVSLMSPVLPLENLYAAQEATVRIGHRTTDWFQIGKGVRQGCILSSCLYNLYAEYIMTNAGLEETQAGIKIAGRNINHLRYSDDTTLMAESKELKRLDESERGE